MNRLLVFILVALVGFGVYVYFLETVEAPSETPKDRVMDIETYVRENISTLSPEKEVLGGSFYVTDIATTDGAGTVWYEDGHVAFIADFTYVIDKYGITVSSFDVRK